MPRCDRLWNCIPTSFGRISPSGAAAGGVLSSPWAQQTPRAAAAKKRVGSVDELAFIMGE